MISLTKSGIANDVLIYVASKSRHYNPKTIEVPLSKTAKRIIEKYKDYDTGKLLPFVERYKYNKAIKEACRLAGLDRKAPVLDPHTRTAVYKPLYEIATSHMARRTFVGNLYKKVKDANLVGALSGHKEGSKAFARYRDIDMEMKREIVASLGF